MVNDLGTPAGQARGETAHKGTLGNPLDFIAADHMRKREVCTLIDKLAAKDRVSVAQRTHVLDFLNRELPHHLEDEEIDLFPMMLARCEPEDEIEKVIQKLLSDHRHAIADAPCVAALIAAHDVDDTSYGGGDTKRMQYFADKSRRHLILENAVILPIARARLTDADLAVMKQHMLQRRGETEPPAREPK